MPSKQSGSLWTFIVVFGLLSVFMWFVSFVPALKMGVSKVQTMLTTIFETPFVGLALFGLMLLIYFTSYYTAPGALENDKIFVSNFTNIWILFLSAIIALMTAQTMFKRV
jgi:hypothetical protein